jgi:hypothetical protein
MTPEQKLLIDALSVAVCGQHRKLDLQVDWQKLIQLASIHNLLPMLCDGLRKMPDAWNLLPEVVRSKLDSAYIQAVSKDIQLEYTQQRLTHNLSQSGVPHIFLKGAVLKYDYPVPALRTMCDLDVLIYTKDLKAIDKAARTLGGTAKNGDGNHHNYHFPGGILVEFHPNLLHHATQVAAQINPGWQYAADDEHEYSRSLTEEGIYLNTICHLADHFVSGGVGVRFVLDVWVCRHLRNKQPDRAFVEAELSKFGLLEFTRNIEQLAECWFMDAESTSVLDEMGDYILTSGSYGSMERAALNAVSLAPGGSRLKALLRKVFYPRQELEDRFPWCKGKAWLLPVAWCLRVCRAIILHGKHIVKWSSNTAKINKAQLAAHQESLRRFGISTKQ